MRESGALRRTAIGGDKITAGFSQSSLHLEDASSLEPGSFRPTRDRLSEGSGPGDEGPVNKLSTAQQERMPQWMRGGRSVRRAESLSTQKKTIDDGNVELNFRCAPLVYCLALVWVVASSLILLASTWLYALTEVNELVALSVGTAVLRAQLAASQAIAPASAVARALDVAFRAGSVTSPSDYAGLSRAFAPHFESEPALLEVELTDPQIQKRTSVLVSPSEHHVGGIHIRTNNGDCGVIEGQRGCTVEALEQSLATWAPIAKGLDEISEWHAAPLPVSWKGPMFVGVGHHEAICTDLCWRPSLALLAKVSRGFPAVSGSSSVSMRVSLDVSVLQDSVRMAERYSRGEAFICTSDGTVLAARDMALGLSIDPSTGTLNARSVWDLPRPWAPQANAAVVSAAVGASGNSQLLDSLGTLFDPSANSRSEVWVYRLNGISQPEMASDLRLVLAVPRSAFIDSVLGPLTPACLFFGCLPYVLWVGAFLIAIYIKQIKGRLF